MATRTETTGTDGSTHEKNQPYQDDLTENRMASPQEREDVAHDLRLDPGPGDDDGGDDDDDDEDEEDDDHDEDDEAE